VSATAAVRWSVATAVFLLIGLVNMRYGNAVGLAALIVVLAAVFVLDVRSRRS